jgi:chromosome segregation ATPase
VTAETESLILEILKKIQADLAEMKQDIRDLTVRVGLVEGHVSHLIAAQHHSNERLDRMSNRIERIEQRLNLVDAR